VLHAYGLFLVRQGESEQALGALEKAAKSGPEQTRFQYAYALALDANGQHSQALDILKDAHDRRPADRDVLFALATFHAKADDREAAARYAGLLLELAPWDPNARALARQLDTNN
jgi:Flp pilus assembly protein TadD